MPLLHKVTISLFTVFVVVWFYLAFFPEPVLNKQALGPEAKDFVTHSLKEFCAGLYTDGICPKIVIAGKQRWVASTYLGGSDIPTQQTDSILAGQGWHKMPADYERTTVYCKQGYSARYDYKADYVGTLSFAAGSHVCEKIARAN
ncbi:hypothetical protein ACN9MZ_14170 [Pseudoduganella sp. S-14]|jgi:hypothetical protein|uniref:hypothetical protein n=1 Tax=Pseudoduganella sp. S-14 TaxID=3404065 RepID=UPI003CF01F27